MQGTALQDGQKGETISVRNERSGKIISAQVTGMNVLRLHGDLAPASLPQH
ncbi:flagellar basal body P-ring biosynthesis protein FlgA [compost metagenome]